MSAWRAMNSRFSMSSGVKAGRSKSVSGKVHSFVCPQPMPCSRARVMRTINRSANASSITPAIFPSSNRHTFSRTALARTLPRAYNRCWRERSAGHDRRDGKHVHDNSERVISNRSPSRERCNLPSEGSARSVPAIFLPSPFASRWFDS